jgi:hypothetical protein
LDEKLNDLKISIEKENKREIQNLFSNLKDSLINAQIQNNNQIRSINDSNANMKSFSLNSHFNYIKRRLTKKTRYLNRINQFNTHQENDTVPQELYYLNFPNPLFWDDINYINEHNRLIKEFQTNSIKFSLNFMKERIATIDNELLNVKELLKPEIVDVDQKFEEIQNSVNKNLEKEFRRTDEKLKRFQTNNSSKEFSIRNNNNKSQQSNPNYNSKNTNKNFNSQNNKSVNTVKNQRFTHNNRVINTNQHSNSNFKPNITQNKRNSKPNRFHNNNYQVQNFHNNNDNIYHNTNRYQSNCHNTNNSRNISRNYASVVQNRFYNQNNPNQQNRHFNNQIKQHNNNFNNSAFHRNNNSNTNYQRNNNDTRTPKTRYTNNMRYSNGDNNVSGSFLKNRKPFQLKN